MQLEKARIKAKKKKIKQIGTLSAPASLHTPVEDEIGLAQDWAAETLAEEGKEELGSWEDLHKQFENIESMYPSAPSGTILEATEPAEDVLYPPVPLLTMQVSQINTKEEISTLELDVLTPSAPLEQPTQIIATAPTLEQSYLNWNPLPSNFLERIYLNPLELEHKDTVAAFRSSSLIGNDDWLYRMLLEYEQACAEVESASKRAARSSESIKSLTQKYWNIHREPISVNEYCADGWSLTHTYIDEIPICDHDLDIFLEKSCHSYKKEVYIELATASNDCSVSKAFVQSHLDDLLSKEVKEKLKQAQIEGLFFLDDSFSPFLKDVMRALDVFFVFERRSKHESGESLFQRHVHDWITALAGYIFRSGNIFLNRRVLLHILRTNSISTWGQSLVNFPNPITFSEMYVDNYLVSLKAFLGPIEELEELLGPKRKEESLEKQNIQTREGDKWVVVEDGIFKPSKSSIPNSIILLEDDYLCLLSQFNIVANFRYFVRYYFLESISFNESFSSILTGNLIMKGFSIAHQMFSILSRTFSLFPMSFLQFRSSIASLLVLINDALVEILKLLPSEHLNTHLCFSLPDNFVKTTCLQAELDSFLFRSIRCILSKFATGMEAFVINLPLEKLSKPASVKVMEDVLSGILFHDSLEEGDEKLLAVLLRDQDSGYLFNLLQKLLLVGADMGKTVGNNIVGTCFDICLSNTDFQQRLFGPVRDTLQALCTFSPHLIGFIIQRSVEKISVTEAVILELFASLPIPKWIPQPVDVLLIENMLKDPIGSVKYKLACRVVDSITWESQSSISYESHKILAFALANIHLDLLGRSQPNGIIQETSSVISKSAIRLVSGIGLLHTVDKFESFNSWIWSTLQRLQLYRRPISTNAYSLVDDSEGLQLESWDSPSISPLKSYSSTDSIAAYIVLLVSEVGHRFDLFDIHGWSLLHILLQNGHIIPFLKASFDIFRNFLMNSVSDIFSTTNYRKLILQFCKIASTKKIDVSLLAWTLEKSEDIPFAIIYWCNMLFADHDWMHSRWTLELLDELSRLVFPTQYASDLLSIFSIQYRSILFGYEGISPSKTSSPDAAGFLTSFFDSSPLRAGKASLIQEISGQYFGKGKYVAEGLWYFLAFAFSAEVFAEREVRSRVGQQLISGNHENFEKPINLLSTVRIADLLVGLPLEHPVSPVFWQTFFSLYFERIRTAEGRNVFGHLFLDDKKPLLMALERKLNSFECINPALSNWKKLTVAFALWLFDSRILSNSAQLDQFDAKYCPPLLRCCVNGLLFENGPQEWWLQMIPSSSSSDNNKDILTSSIDIAVMIKRRPLVNLQPPRSFPVLVFPEPLLPSLACVDAQLVMKFIGKDLSLLKQYGLQHSSSIQSHGKLDAEYMKLLSCLYTTTSASTLATKRCSGSCQGVIFQYDQKKSILNGDISKALSKNRKQIESLVGQDIVNSRTTIASIRISKCLQWLLNFEGNEKRPSRECVSLFYTALDLLDERLHAYPPAEKILNSIIKEIGLKFIVGSPAETGKIFAILSEGRHSIFLAPYFIPACIPESFVDMYRSLSQSLSGNDLQCILSCFHVKQWVADYKPSLEAIISFLDIILDSFSGSKDSEPALAAHLVCFKEILSVGINNVLGITIRKVWKRIVTVGTLPSFIIREWLSVFLNLPSDFDFPENVTLETYIDFDTLFGIISSIQLEFSELLSSNQVKFLHALKSNLWASMLLLHCMFSCDVLFSNTSEYNLHHLWGLLYLIFQSVFQLPAGEITYLKYHEIFEGPEVESFVGLFCSITSKLCYLNGKPSDTPLLLWKMYSKVIPTKSFLLIQAFHAKATAIMSSDFAFGLRECRTIRSWIENDFLTVPCIQFLADLLITSSIDVSNCSSVDGSIADLFYVFLFLLSHLNDIEIAKKKALFSLICKECIEGSQLVGLTSSEFSQCLSILPKKWFDEITSLVVNDSLLPLPASIHITLKLTGVSIVDQPIKCNLIIDYFCLILSQQVYQEFTKDALIIQSRSFRPDSIGDIVSEFLELTEKEWACNCLGYSSKSILVILSKALKEDKVYNRLCSGLMKAIVSTSAPLEYLCQICKSASSPEQMALFCEASISNFIYKKPQYTSWTELSYVLRIPELEESTFIRHCISHCLVFTLYTHSLSKVEAAGTNLNLKLMIGEQIAVWIESLSLDSSVSDPQKVLLMLLQFFSLLRLELETIPDPDHSRLNAHLRPIQEVLFRWSNPPSFTLWSALGFSQQMPLSSDLRLLCRFQASFIASRLIGVDKLMENSKLSDALDEFLASAEYSSLPITRELKSIFQDDSKKIVHIGEVMESLCQSLFPFIFNLVKKK